MTIRPAIVRYPAVAAVVALGVLLFALTGCGPTAEELAIADDQKCQALGFERGTEAYGACRLQAESNRAAQDQARAAAYGASVQGARNARNAMGLP